MSGVVRNVLLADLVSGAGDPVLGVTAASAEHILVDAPVLGQLNFICLVTGHFEHLQIALVTSGKADLTVDRPRSFSTEIVFSWNVTSVARKVLAGPGTGVGGQGRTRLESGVCTVAGRLALREGHLIVYKMLAIVE